MPRDFTVSVLDLRRRLVLVELATSVHPYSPQVDWVDLAKAAAAATSTAWTDYIACLCRSVELGRLDNVMRTGIDVEPSDAPFFADSFEKAMEYGGWPKLMLWLDPSAMTRSYRRLRKEEADQARGRALLRNYPTRVDTADGAWTVFSRFPAARDYAGTGYELAHGWWIPEDPLRALFAIMVFTHPLEGGNRGVMHAVDSVVKSPAPQ